MDDELQRRLETSSSRHSELGNCSCCKKFTWLACEEFGAQGNFDQPMKKRNLEFMRKKDHLPRFMKEIFIPQLKEYSLIESNGTKGVHLTIHRHFHPYYTTHNRNTLLKEEILSLPIFPVFHNLQDVDAMLKHAMYVFTEIEKQFEETDLEIYLSIGSSGRALISVIGAYSHFVRGKTKLNWKLYNLTRDENYGGDDKREGYQMTPDSSKNWQEESARQREEITHLKTELAGLDSELLKVTSLLSDLGSTLSAESVRINSLLEKKSEEE